VSDRYASEAAFHDALAHGQARSADRFYSVNRRSWAWYRDLLLAEAGSAQARGGIILEYGCGIGAYSSLALAEAGYACVGVDISPESVRSAEERARAEFPDVALEYRVMNAEDLDFPDDSFDLVCGNGIVHHLELDAAYAEVARVLKPDGVAVFSEPLGHNPLINLYRRLTPDQRTPDEHPLRTADIERARRYFGTVEWRSFHLFALGAIPLRKTRLFEPLLGALDRVDAVVLRGAPSLGWLAVIRVAAPRV
jgi:SAM-dependent methyltransferase